MNATGIRIKKLIVHQTGTYNPQFRRPYQTELTGYNEGLIVERLQGSTKYQASQFAGVANQFLRPQVHAERPIGITNGWNEARLRFFLEVEHVYSSGASVTEFLTGYTDYPGISLQSHAFDPNMEFFINNTVQLRHTNYLNEFQGAQSAYSIVDASHLLADTSALMGGLPGTETLMRPHDVFASMGTAALHGLGNVVDIRTNNSLEAQKSKRMNNSTTNYLADILDNYRASYMATNESEDNNDILSRARGLARENSASSDPFLKAISAVRGLPVGNTFRYSDLQRMDGTVDQRTIFVAMNQASRATVHQAGMTASWEGTDRHTHVATILSQAVPALMMELMISRIALKTTNHTINSQVVTQIANVDSLATGMDITQNVHNFIMRLEHEILADISFNNQVGFSIDIEADLLGETWLRINLDSQQYDYVAPSFCDALLTPVITSNRDQAMTVAREIDDLFGNVHQALNCKPSQGFQSMF